MSKSKYYYDYTRNLSHEQAEGCCGRPNCVNTKCKCSTIQIEKKKEDNEDWTAWVSNLEDAEQPKACDIDNPDCENCGS